MASRKQIPNGLAKRYISVEAELSELQDTRKTLKARLDKLVARGYTSSLLEITEVERASVPWRDIAEELAERFMSSGEIHRWNRGIAKKYPAKPIAPTIRAVAVEEGD